MTSYAEWEQAGAVGMPPAPDPPFDVELPAGFTQVDDLAEIAAYVAAQLHAGLSKREILRRLHGWVPGGEG